MFEGHKIKKLISQLALATGDKTRLELNAKIIQYGPTAFPHLCKALKEKKLDPVKGQILIEKLYDASLMEDLIDLTGDSFDAVRIMAKKLILKNLNQKVLKKLIENLLSPNSYLKTSAAGLLCEIKSQSSVVDLVSLFNKGDLDCKLNVLNIIGETGGDIAIKLLISALKSKEWRMRVRAVRSLGKMKSYKSVEPLIEILDERDPQMKKSVLDALMEIEDKRSVLPVLALLKDEDLMVRQKAVDCINIMADSQIMPQLLQLLREPEVNTRRCAIEIINKMKDPNTGEALVKAMKDSDWWVRNIAVDALAEIKGENTIKIIIAMLNDSDENIRRCAVEFFNKVSDSSSVAPLIGLLEDKDWWVREKAVTALGRLKDKRAIKPLTELANDDEIKWVIPGALGEIGGKDIIEPLKIFLSDQQKQVRLEAIRALGRINNDEAIKEIKGVLEDSEEEVRSEAAKILKKLTGKIFLSQDGKPLKQPVVEKVSGVTVPEGSILTEAVVVVDLCNSTGIADKYGNQFALNLTKILTENVNQIVKKENIQFMKSTGDGFLLTFPKIKNAVNFVFDLQNNIGKYNTNVDEAEFIELRFAINFGETRVDAKGDRLGVATNMTFRVEGVKAGDIIEVEEGIKKDQMPGSNRILITENVVEEANKVENIKAVLLGLFELKGISGLHRIYKLTNNK